MEKKNDLQTKGMCRKKGGGEKGVRGVGKERGEGKEGQKDPDGFRELALKTPKRKNGEGSQRGQKGTPINPTGKKFPVVALN